MKIKRTFAVLVLGLTVLTARIASAANDAMPKMSSTAEVNWTADHLPFKDVIPGVKKAVLWENAQTGAYAAITKIAAGTKNPLHTHSSDIKIVVISGAYVYGTEKGMTRFGPGSYVLVPGGRVHTSAGDDKEGATFFEESTGKFDMNLVQPKK